MSNEQLELSLLRHAWKRLARLATVVVVSAGFLSVTFSVLQISSLWPDKRPPSSEDLTTPFSSNNVVIAGNSVSWQHNCVPLRVGVIGIGMGNGSDVVTNPQTLVLSPPTVTDNWLLAQVIGRYETDNGDSTPESVNFTSDAPDDVTVYEPIDNSLYAYSYVTKLQTVNVASQITAAVQPLPLHDSGARALVAYASQSTPGQWWTSIGKLNNQFVWGGLPGHGVYTETLTFASLSKATELYITAVVVDNNADERPLVLKATTGSVTETSVITSSSGPSHGERLNIASLRLLAPVGSNHVHITLESPVIDGNVIGDSLVLAGTNVSYACARPDTYLPLIILDPTPTPTPTPTPLPGCFNIQGNNGSFALAWGPLEPNVTYCTPMTDVEDYYFFVLTRTVHATVTVYTQPLPTHGWIPVTYLEIYNQPSPFAFIGRCCRRPHLELSTPVPLPPYVPYTYYVRFYVQDLSTLTYSIKVDVAP